MGTTIWVRTTTSPDGVQIVVEDDGPGVPTDMRGRVFEPFQQGPSTLVDPRPGTGIGLALVERLVALHDGTVTCDERPGGGARFTVRLDAPRAP
jgi:two-component system, OmpR family, sensor histidine kinase MtrB